MKYNIAKDSLTGMSFPQYTPSYIQYTHLHPPSPEFLLFNAPHANPLGISVLLLCCFWPSAMYLSSFDFTQHLRIEFQGYIQEFSISVKSEPLSCLQEKSQSEEKSSDSWSWSLHWPYLQSLSNTEEVPLLGQQRLLEGSGLTWDQVIWLWVLCSCLSWSSSQDVQSTGARTDYKAGGSWELTVITLLSEQSTMCPRQRGSALLFVGKDVWGGLWGLCTPPTLKLVWYPLLPLWESGEQLLCQPDSSLGKKQQERSDLGRCSSDGFLMAPQWSPMILLRGQSVRWVVGAQEEDGVRRELRSEKGRERQNGFIPAKWHKKHGPLLVFHYLWCSCIYFLVGGGW